MDEQELRAYVEKKLRARLSQFVWKQLAEDGYIEEVRRGELSPDELLVDKARVYHKLWQADPLSESVRMGQVQKKVAPRPDDYENARSEAYSAYLAKAAAGDRRVQRFRERRLRRGLLTPEEAKDVENRSQGFKGDLHRLCSYLSAHYPWSEDEAVRFVLTDEAPEVASLFGRMSLSGNEQNLFSYGSIILTVEPWVSAESVERFYREMQSQMLGRKPRKIEQRNLEVFRFVVEWGDAVEWEVVRSYDEEVGYFTIRTRMLVGKPPWRKLLKLWNERYSEGHKWRYKDARNFQRDFNRAASVVSFPVTDEAYDRLSLDRQEIPTQRPDTS